MSSGLQAADSERWAVFFGTYTSGTNEGIYVSDFDAGTGEMSAPKLAAKTRNPSFLAIHPNRQWLYAVSEVGGSNGKPSGGVSAFSLDRSTRTLSLLNQQASGGNGPCHVSVDRSGKSLMVANYGSGSVAALKIGVDGRLTPGSVQQHKGSSVNPKRQAGPHAHQAVASLDNRFALVCDLGLDKVLIYELDSSAAILQPHAPAAATLHAGAGPRHLAFRPDGKFFYVINELDSTMSVFRWDAETGAGKEVQTLSTLPNDFKGESYCAAVVVHPNGRFVYGSNRGHDSIAVFESDKDTGRLRVLQHVNSGGKWPRFITLDPTGKWMFSLNQNSGDIVVLPVDPATGKLSTPATKLQLDSPVCAVFAPIAPKETP